MTQEQLDNELGILNRKLANLFREWEQHPEKHEQLRKDLNDLVMKKIKIISEYYEYPKSREVIEEAEQIARQI